jgi:hypothetical protein
MKLTKTNLANAFSVTAVFIWIVCTVGVVLFPSLSYVMGQWLTHESAVLVMGQWNVTLIGFISGGLVLAILTWFSGFVFGWTLEYLNKK